MENTKNKFLSFLPDFEIFMVVYPLKVFITSSSRETVIRKFEINLLNCFQNRQCEATLFLKMAASGGPQKFVLYYAQDHPNFRLHVSKL